MDGAKLSWGRAPGNPAERWPKNAAGEPEQGAFLTRLFGDEVRVDMTVEMLRAYGIPAVKHCGDHGTLGKVVLGFSGTGTALYVPESMLEDARNLLRPVGDTDEERSEQ